MRTSHSQFCTMLDYMERYGDLSKVTGGPRSRQFIQMMWKKLTHELNSDGNGLARSEEKWRKVWSDFKTNTKKKQAKIRKAQLSGGPAYQSVMTNLEKRLLQIIGSDASLVMEKMEKLDEAGFQETEDGANTPHSQPEEFYTHPNLKEETVLETGTATDADWYSASTSNQSATEAPPSYPQETTVQNGFEAHWTPPPPKRKKLNVVKLFVEADRKAREYEKERDLAYERLETERLRLQEYELRERVRQRDQELRLQAQWLDFMKEALNIIGRHFERNGT